MSTQKSVVANIVPNEVLFPNSTLIVESRLALDPRSAQSAIVVRGEKGQVRLTRGARRATWSSEEPLQPGHHMLLVRGLVTAKQQGIEDEMQIPFFVTDSVAQVPRTVRVENIVRLRFHEMGVERLSPTQRPSGSYLELMKGSRRKSGAPVELAFDQTGRTVKPEQAFQQVTENRLKRYGKLHETLYAQMQEAGEEKRIPVALWLRSEEALALDPKKNKRTPARPTKEILARRQATAKISETFAALHGEQYGRRNFRPDVHAPVVYAELTRAQIEELANDPDVLRIFLYEPEGREDLDHSVGIANSDDAHSLGFRGSGVKVAVWEDGPDDTSNLTITASYKTSGFATSQHARHTHGIVKNKESNKPHGHAPSCSLHSANSKDLDALRWAVKDKGCTVISQSFHRSSEPGSATMSYDDIYKDWLALHWPYPTICQAAGNFWADDPDDIEPPSSEYVNHKGYNGLMVGNHDDTASAMSGDSVFRNPSSNHGDRELPEIAANGTSVTTVGLTMGGTSMAAPAVAGSAAIIQSVDATLKSWPEGCRAILLGGAKRNVVANTWWQDVVANTDASDGTGALDSLEAVKIAQQRRWRNAAATLRGWDVGTLRSSDIGSNRRTSFSYSVQVPRSWFGPRHVKVALAWDSKISSINFFGIEILLGSLLTVDLDLQVFDSRGNQVGYSGSWDNSYEIVEFDGYPGETYTIKIRRWSGTDDVWYGIAWTVTGGLFWADATRFSVLQQLLENRSR